MTTKIVAIFFLFRTLLMGKSCAENAIETIDIVERKR